jgi:hypothetical protein
MPLEYLRDYFLTWHAAVGEARYRARRDGVRQRVWRGTLAGSRVWLVAERVSEPCS